LIGSDFGLEKPTNNP